EGQGCQDTEVGVGPGAGSAAEAEGVEEVALPVQPGCRGVGDQAPAEGGGGEGQEDWGERYVAVAAGGAVEVGFVVIAAAQGQVGEHDAAPGGDGDAERGEEAHERAEEVVGD